ncbi:MAG: LemA family protein [Intrasporangium sp.]|uniref:LemA family protein n=1 Tax=Intrasporangium sp. TaxID=1925024 RepID=UPI003F7EB247
MIVVWIILGLIVLLAIWGVATYNGLIGSRNKVEEGWRQIDVELKRRHDLIPNVVETVKGYAQHERGTLEEVMRARSVAMSGGQTPAQAAQTEGVLSQALGRLIAVAEAYPDLKANQNFLALQQELSSTEDRIASSRRYYNALVRELNTKVESVPSNFIANTAGIKRAEYFETPATEAVAPSVNFGSGGLEGGGPAGAVGPSTAPGAVGGASTQPGSLSGPDVPWRSGGDDPLVTSGHDDDGQQPLPNPNVDRTPPND